MKEFQDFEFQVHKLLKDNFSFSSLQVDAFSLLFLSSYSYIKNPFGQMSSVDTLRLLRALERNAWKISSMYILGNLANSCIFPLEIVSKAT